MKKDKLRLYILEVSLIIVLLLALFVSNIFNKKLLALLLAILAIIIYKVVQKKRPLSFYRNQVALLMAGFALIYLGVFYLMGLYFGYYKAPTIFGWKTIYHFIIPISIIIVSSEFIRHKLIIQSGKASKILITISMVLIDLLLYTSAYNITKLIDMLTVVGFITFASIACNLLYNYTSYRYGVVGIIVYRLITILYAYFIPYIPNVYIFFRSFLRMLYPYIIYLVLEYTYSKSNFATAYKDQRKNVIATSILTFVMVVLIALISCRFEYGVLVVGSGSMTGTFDKGDAVLYQAYHDEDLALDKVIIFNNGNIQTIHRIIKIESINGETRYYTKGDANKKMDDGYVTKDRIVGTVKFKIKYIGFPTLWLRDIFEH